MKSSIKFFNYLETKEKESLNAFHSSLWSAARTMSGWLLMVLVFIVLIIIVVPFLIGPLWLASDGGAKWWLLLYVPIAFVLLAAIAYQQKTMPNIDDSTEIETPET